jgi:hypothetical protein
MRDSNIPHTSFDSRGRNAAPWERLGLVAMAVLTAFFLATSWRRWLDPLIDFGRELYLPWRISNGAMLYRDVDDFYGPLSQYLNACLFRVFGPGLMVLVAANLAVYAAVLGLIYMLFRRAWGVGAALASCAVFVSVFSFSQFYGGNHNFAAPYAHEATHGFLVCLLLVLTLSWWLERPAAARAALAGLLLGLTVVLKPEIMLAAALVTGAALFMGYLQGRPLPASSIAAWAAAAPLPTLVFWGYFSASVPPREAFLFASRAWVNVVATTRFASDPVQITFLGLDRPGAHLLEHGSATLIAILLLAAIVASAKAADRAGRLPVRILALGLLAAGLFLLSWVRIGWLGVGRCLLGLTLFYLAGALVPIIRRSKAGEDVSRPALRWMIAALAAGLMARMILNGRIYQFGFYQAALAGILVPAVMIGEVPERFSLGRRGRATLVTLSILLMGTGVVRLVIRSQSLFDLKTYAVGRGVDRFYSIPPQIDASGALVNFASDELGKVPRNQTLLVIPEGEMINYLARLPSPVAPFFFFSAATQDGREQAIVADLSRRPPNWVVLVSRDLREYGVARYGESPDQGGQILGWVAANYRPVASIGDDPLDVHKRGAVILAPKQ